METEMRPSPSRPCPRRTDPNLCANAEKSILKNNQMFVVNETREANGSLVCFLAKLYLYSELDSKEKFIEISRYRVYDHCDASLSG